MDATTTDVEDLYTVVTSKTDANVKAAYDRLVERHGKGVLKDMIKTIAARAGAGNAAGAAADVLIKVGECAGDVGNAFARGMEIANAGTVATNVSIEFSNSCLEMPDGHWWEARSLETRGCGSFGYGYYRNGKLYAISLTTVKRGFVGNIFRSVGIIKDKPQWVATRIQ